MDVLIVEDDPVSSKVLARMLEKMGHRVTAAWNGREAWDLVRQGSVRLVISDWMMPEMDGLGLCRQVRTLSDGRYIYFILCTAKDRKEDRLEGLQAGADDFLTKPLDWDELVARVEVAQRILAMQEQLQSHAREVEALHDEVEAQNRDLHDAMDCLRQASRRFQELFDGLPVACFTYDSAGRIFEWNRAAADLYGISGVEAFELPLWEAIGRTDDADVVQEIISRVFQGERFDGLEFGNCDAHGRRRCVLCNTFPLRGPDGGICGAISANIDITSRKALERQVEEQLRRANDMNAVLELQRKELESANVQLAETALTDGLTGLRNHRCFRSTLDSAFALARRQNMPLSVLMLDVDRFKQFNDTFGHQAGDEVLRAVADTVRGSVREQDLVARYGGEEFAVLLPGTDITGSMEAAERMRQAIHQHHWPDRPITASLGVSTLSSLTGSPSELLEQADRALYHSKAHGRDRVSHHAGLNHARTAA